MPSSILHSVAVAFLLLIISTEALLHRPSRSLAAVTAPKVKSPSPKLKPKSPTQKPKSPPRSPSPKPSTAIRRCVWYNNECVLNAYYFLTTAVPTATDPYTQKLMSITGLDFQCSAHTSQKNCHLNTKRFCIWMEGQCVHALRDAYACPVSKVTAFSTCDYFNTVKAPAATCTANRPCLWLPTRGCVHPTFKSLTAAQLKQYREKVATGGVDIRDYGCCSSFLSRRDMIPTTCYDLDQADCKRAAAADCTWWSDGYCGLTTKAEQGYELEGLKTADPAYGVAYVSVTNYCAKQKSRAACIKQYAGLDQKKVVGYSQPHREEALDWNTYCSGQILGP